MPVLFNHDRKVCGTCAFWSGNREIVSNGANVRCKNPSDEGICTNPKSQFKGKPKKADNIYCSKFIKWQFVK